MRALLDEELELDEMFREVDDDAEFEAHGKIPIVKLNYDSLHLTTTCAIMI